MSSGSFKCKISIENMDSNNNLSMNSYSLRPRGTRRPEEPRPSESDKPRHSRTKLKPRSMPLSKYRRKTANARERSRMLEINEAFETLRRVIPQMTSTECTGEKLTKISTLRLAMNYISALSSLLQDRDLESDGESFLGDYALSTSPDSHDGLPAPSLLVATPSVCSGVPLHFMDSYESSAHVFEDSSYLLEDVPLFMSEFS